MTPDALAQAQEIAAGVLANVTSDHLDLPTPCDNWNVSQLIDHMVGTQHWARAVIDSQEPTETGEGASAGDFNAAFADAAGRNLASFRADGAMERIVDAGFGEMPAIALLGLATTDTFAHAWDLATATGQDDDLDADLAVALLAGAKRTLPPAFRSEEGSIFKPEQTAPDGANAARQLAAFLGRTVPGS